MWPKVIILVIFSLSLQAWGRAPSSYSDLRSELQKYSSREMIDFIQNFIKASSPSRMIGLPGHDKARDFILSTIKTYDSKSTGILNLSSRPADVESVKKFYQKDFDQKVEGKIPKHSSDYKMWSRFTSSMKDLSDAKKDVPVQNIVWEKVGLNSKKVLVVTAHYDTISHDKKTLLVNEKDVMPGANYNASGVAVALGLIKVLSHIDLNYSVKIVFLDWQGIGFHGSEIYAKELKNSSSEVIGVINLEMLGQDSSFLDKNKKLGNMSVYSRNLSQETQWVSKLISHGKGVIQKVTFEPKSTGFDNSDNFRFWDQNFMAVTFSQNWEDDFNPKFYQTPQDTSEILNHETLYSSYQYVGGAVVGTLLDLTK